MKTELAFILDRSSSMESIRTAAISGFNQFLRDQQAAPDQSNLTLVFFDTEIETYHNSLPIADFVPLNLDTYVPSGATALLDAIGETIDRFGKKFAAMPEADRPNTSPSPFSPMARKTRPPATPGRTSQNASSTRPKNTNGSSSSSVPAKTPSPPPRK